MTARQTRQLYFLDMIGSFGSGKESIDSEEEVFRCECDSCGTGTSKAFWTCDDVREWIAIHDDHETRIWFAGIPAIESKKQPASGDQNKRDNALLKIEKLQKLAKGTSYEEEVETAIQKLNELFKKYGID